MHIPFPAPSKPASAQAGAKLPVHVWIHGGGFAAGAGSDPDFDNLPDVRAGMVYATLNYRVNLFGFLSHPCLSAESGTGTSCNHGLMDQIPH